MGTIIRKLEFDYGHRVLGHEGKCKHLHGHRGVAEITVRAPKLDDLGRVIDFGVIKQLIGGWIDENWDHNILLHQDDPLTQLFESMGEGHPIFGGKKPYIIGNGLNPTAEVMAEVLFRQANRLLKGNLMAWQVRFFETPNSSAIYPDQDR